MAKKKKLTPKLGDHVKIRYWPNLKAQVVEERGPLGPKGARVFRLRVEGDPEPTFTEVLEEQLEVIPAVSRSNCRGGTGPSSTRRIVSSRPFMLAWGQRLQTKALQAPLTHSSAAPGKPVRRGRRRNCA